MSDQPMFEVHGLVHMHAREIAALANELNHNGFAPDVHDSLRRIHALALAIVRAEQLRNDWATHRVPPIV